MVTVSLQEGLAIPTTSARNVVPISVEMVRSAVTKGEFLLCFFQPPLGNDECSTLTDFHVRILVVEPVSRQVWEVPAPSSLVPSVELPFVDPVSSAAMKGLLELESLRLLRSIRRDLICSSAALLAVVLVRNRVGPAHKR